MKFTAAQIKERRMLRLAQIILDHWEEQSGMDTRFFEVPFIHDSMILKGTSKKGGGYREHVVPRAFLRDECLKMYATGATVEDVKERLMQYLWIVHITPGEADHLDHQVKHKTTMPDGWVFGESDPLERLKSAGIELA